MFQLSIRLRKTKQFTPWLAIWAMCALLGQSLLPSFAYARSDLNPGLWNEICSVYGSRQFSADKSAPDGSGSSHRADCPLCLHLLNDFIIGPSVLNPEFQLLLTNEVSYAALPDIHFIHPAVTPEARGPPIFFN